MTRYAPPPTTQSEFILRQENKILQRMNDSKASEIRRLKKHLAEQYTDLLSMYALWKEIS